MKVDRINQSQIRFMLCRKDLEERDLNVKELAYGSEKTKALFDDMMAEARREFNFNEQGQPLMIEAIPLSDDQLMITVTLVNGAAEKLGLSAGNVPGLGPEGAKSAAAPADGKAAELEELLKELEAQAGEAAKDSGPRPMIYIFDRFEDLLAAAARIKPELRLKNSLYREEGASYYLMIEFKKMDRTAGYVMSMMNEFSSGLMDVPYGELLIREHCKPVIKTRALQKLSAVENPEE